LLLRILQQNTSFGESNPLTPILSTRAAAVTAQSILFTSLSVTLFVAFVAVFGRQWIHSYTRGTTWRNIADRGKERQTKLTGLHKWGLHLILESLPVMLQFSILLFGAALAVYLWDVEITVAEVVLVVTSVGVVLYSSIAVTAAICCGYPFQTPLSALLPKVLPWVKEFTALARVWSRRRTASLLLQTQRAAGRGRLASSLGRLLKNFPGGMNTSTDNVDQYDCVGEYPMTLENPIFWRQDPLFTSPIPEDIAASAGFWLLENSTDSSAVSAFAATFPELQSPARPLPTAALTRLHDTYMECFGSPAIDKHARLTAVQSAAAYYVIYHNQLIWSASTGLEVGAGKLPSNLPSDLFLHQHNDEWDGDDTFEYLLHIKVEDRSEPAKSARFLSYIAPYWFCGDTDSAIRFRPSRLQTLNDLIEVLEESRALTPATVADCILCAGVAMDFPLHPEDLIRVDKQCVPFPRMLTMVLIEDSDYPAPTFKMVVEHLHGIVLANGRRRRYAKTALEILLNLAKKAKTSFPPVDGVWINDLLKRAAWGKMDDETFTVLLRFSALRKEEDAAIISEIPSERDYDHIQRNEANPQSPGWTVRPEQPTPEYTLLDLVLRNVKACSAQKDGWQDDAVYGGLIIIKDIPGLQFCLPEAGFLETLSKAMEKEKPFRVRKAAYDVVLVARYGWLKSADLRKTLECLDFPRKLHSVMIETGRSNHQRSFLEMMEILSEDRYWHPYLRKAMDIWLPLHHEGPAHALRILTNVGELLLPGRDDYNPDRSLEKVLEDQWAAVPGRLPKDLTVDLLEPLAEVTEQFKKLFFFTESSRGSVLAVVERVIPALERRRNYSGPDNDIRHTIDNLVRVLQEPIHPSSRRPTYW
jgi:hypothetical protein